MTTKSRQPPGGRQRAQCPRFLFGAKGASAGTEYPGIMQRFPYRCDKTKTSRTVGRRSPWSPRRRHHQCLLQAKTTFSQDSLYWLSTFKLAVLGSLPAQYLGRGPGPLYIGLATKVEEKVKLMRIPHHHKNTSPREAILPLYCSSSAPEAIYRTTHWSRVLHHNGGPNQYKSYVPRVVHHLA